MYTLTQYLVQPRSFVNFFRIDVKLQVEIYGNNANWDLHNKGRHLPQQRLDTIWKSTASMINSDFATRQVCVTEYVEKGKQNSASSVWQSLCHLLAEMMSYALV